MDLSILLPLDAFNDDFQVIYSEIQSKFNSQ